MSFSAVAITAGSGTNVAVDTVASNNYQRVKLVDGTADGTGAIGGDATNGLDVDVTRVSGTVTVANGGTFAVQAVCTNAGTFAVQAAQSGTWNITNVSGTISLPTGASTAAKQPALGTAGTASADVITVQGIAAMTPLLMQLSGTNTLTTVTTVGTVTTITNVVHVDDNSGSLTVDAPVGTPVFVRLSDGASAITTLPVSLASVPSHAVTNAGTFVVQVDGAALTALQLIDNLVLAEDAVHGSGDPGVQSLAVRKDTAAALAGTDGDYAPLEVDANGRLHVIEPSAAAAAASLSVLDDWDNAASDGASVSGDVAHDAADAGEPVKIGGRAMTTARTAVADADRADMAVDVQGRVITEPYGPRELDVMQSTTITSSTSETTVGTAVASTFLDVIDCIVCNSSATATLVTFKDSTAGTTRFVLYVPAGATVGFSGQRWPQAAVNTNWTATCGTSVASVYVSLRMRKTK